MHVFCLYLRLKILLRSSCNNNNTTNTIQKASKQVSEAERQVETLKQRLESQRIETAGLKELTKIQDIRIFDLSRSRDAAEEEKRALGDRLLETQKEFEELVSISLSLIHSLSHICHTHLPYSSHTLLVTLFGALSSLTSLTLTHRERKRKCF